MFKTHILVTQDTDIAAESTKIADMAAKHGVGELEAFTLVRDVESVLSEMKKQDAETSAYGISIGLKKVVSAKDYHVTVELRTRRKMPEGRGFLARLLGKS